MNSLFDLSGKVAVVTGAARGLGEAIATGLSRAGADIVASDVLEISDTIKKIEAENRRAIGIKADVSNEADVKALMDFAASSLGKIDILVNNAGIFRMSPAEDTRPEDWDRVMDINLKGQFLCAKEASRQMIKQKSGKIINIASIAGILAFVESAAYNSSKAGSIQLTKTLAAEWARYNIRVNAICPGIFETEMTKDFMRDAAFVESVKRDVPLGRAGHADELVGAAIYLASKASDYMTGHAMVVDGGWTVRLNG